MSCMVTKCDTQVKRLFFLEIAFVLSHTCHLRKCNLKMKERKKETGADHPSKTLHNVSKDR